MLEVGERKSGRRRYKEEQGCRFEGDRKEGKLEMQQRRDARKELSRKRGIKERSHQAIG